MQPGRGRMTLPFGVYMQTTSKPFERYRTRSALFLMIYAILAIIAGIPNIQMLTREEDRFMVVLATSLLVVSRYVGYIKIAGFALLEPDRIRISSGRIMLELWVIVVVLVANAAIFLYRFRFEDITVLAISAGCVGTACVLISHLVISRKTGITRSTLMRMVSGTLIAVGAADMCITRIFVIPQFIGLITLFFGISTERKSLVLAVKQTVAVACTAVGAGFALRLCTGPAFLFGTQIDPTIGISGGAAVALVGMGYYVYLRRSYSDESTAEKS